MVVKGNAKAVISQVFPMEKVIEAHRHLSNRKTMGKVILQPSTA